jgi:hypothetical protein
MKKVGWSNGRKTTCMAKPTGQSPSIITKIKLKIILILPTKYQDMASTQNKQKVSDMVFEIKQKITDEEYKNIMDGIKKINEKKYVKIHYMVYDIKMRSMIDGEEYPELTASEHNTICLVIHHADPHSLYYNIHHQCILEANILEVWNKYQKGKLPLNYKHDMAQTHILICDFEEL